VKFRNVKVIFINLINIYISECLCLDFILVSHVIVVPHDGPCEKEVCFIVLNVHLKSIFF